MKGDGLGRRDVIFKEIFQIGPRDPFCCTVLAST